MPQALSRPSLWLLATLVMGTAGAAARPAEPPAPIPIRSRDLELHYRLEEAGPTADVELWYTRDRGASWQSYGRDEDRISPFVFAAPAEGLYGLTLIVRDGSRRSAAPPAPFDPPQQWVFVDATPPLVQWDGVEAIDGGSRRPTVQLRWTAHDDHFPSRPVALAWCSSVDQVWHVIEAALANTGRYDWQLPPGLAGQITFRLSVRDLGGQVVERLYGPLPVRQLQPAATAPAVATAPAPAVAPAATQPGAVDEKLLEARRRAEELCRQGRLSLSRGQHAVAAERFREAIEADPDLLAAINELAGIYAQQNDYPKALELYQNILQRDQDNAAALRGLALAYVGRKEYAHSCDALQRLVAGNQQDAQGWLDLGDVLFMMGEQAQARTHWQRAASLEGAADGVAAKARRRLELYAPAPSAGSAAAGSTR